MLKQLNKKEFNELVYSDVLTEGRKFVGDKPCIVDFFAEWCGPCKVIAPVLQEIANENENINVYKVDVDEAQHIAAAFGIRSIPTLLFIPGDGSTPTMQRGAASKQVIEQLIDSTLINPKISDAEIVEETKN